LRFLGATARRREAIWSLDRERTPFDETGTLFFVLENRLIGQPSDRASQCRPTVAARHQGVCLDGFSVREQPSGSLALRNAPFADFLALIGDSVLEFDRRNLDAEMNPLGRVKRERAGCCSGAALRPVSANHLINDVAARPFRLEEANGSPHRGRSLSLKIVAGLVTGRSRD
jgi:hypothetical protein